MKIPNAACARIPREKLQDYILSESHAVGRFKAVFFRSLEYGRNDWRALQEEMFSLLENEAVETERNEYGQKYEVRYKGHIWEVGRSCLGVDHRRRGGFSALHHGISWREPMNISVLDTVVLEKDLPEHGLRTGDIGAIVERYEPDGAEVEFVTASGKTQALLTLKLLDLRPVADRDILAVRPLDAA